MPAPTFVAAGTVAAGTGALTVGLPAGITTGDLLMLVVQTANQPVATPSGWTISPSSPQQVGTAAGAAATALQVFHRFVVGGEGSVSVADGGDHQIARTIAFRGVNLATPFDANAGSTKATASTTATFPSVTTTAIDCLVLLIEAHALPDTNSTAIVSAQAMASLTGITERMDNNTNAGNGGGFSLTTGVKATAGATGTGTATITSSVGAHITLALMPVTPPANQDLAGTLTVSAQASGSLFIGRFETDARVTVGAFADLSVSPAFVEIYQLIGGVGPAPFDSRVVDGDLAIVAAFRSGNVTPPTLPAGWTSLGTANNGTDSIVVGSTAEAGPTVNFSSVFGGSAFTKYAWVLGIAASPSAYVAVLQAQGILRSVDGKTWIPIKHVADKDAAGFDDVYYAQGLFVAHGGSSQILTSPDGLQWTVRSIGGTQQYGAATWNGSEHIALSIIEVAKSPDGITWTKYPVSTLGAFPRDVVWTGSRYVVCTQSSTIGTSTDGITWTMQPAIAGVILNTLCWNGSLLIVGGDGAFWATSPDGLSWTVRSTFTTGTITKIVWDGTKFLAAINSSSGRIWTSTNGTSWTQGLFADRGLFTVCTRAGQIVAGGLFGYLAVSNTPGDGFSNANGFPYPDTGSGEIYGIDFDGTRWAAAGTSGVVYVSTDKRFWEKRTSFTINSITGLVYTGSLWVAAASGQVWTSSDLLSWTQRSLTAGSAGAKLRRAGNFVFSLPGSGNSLYTSPDGITWDTRTLSSSTALSDIAWNGTTYVLVGTFRIYTSGDGIFWSERVADANTYRSVTWNGGLFIATGTAGLIRTSPDGVTWTTRTSGTTDDLGQIRFNGSISLIANGTSSLTSTDGTTWTYRRNMINNSFVATLQWNGAEFLGVGGNRTIIGTTDGVEWKIYNRDIITTFNSVTYADSKFYACLFGNLAVWDGDSGWTYRSIGTSLAMRRMVWTGSQFVVVGASGYIGTGATDQSFTQQNSNTTSQLNGVAWSGSVYVAVGAGGTIVSSTDAVTWTVRTSNTTVTLNEVVWADTQFVVVGASGVIRTSADGVTWATRTSGTAAELVSVAWSGSVLAVVGASGNIRTSPDAATWTARTSGTTARLNSIVWATTNFITVGEQNNIRASADGITWTALVSPNGVIAIGTFTGVAAGPDTVMAVVNDKVFVTKPVDPYIATFTNASAYSIVVYRAAPNVALELGNAATNTGTGTTITLPAVTLSEPSANPLRVSFAWTSSEDATFVDYPDPPAARLRQELYGATGSAASYDSGGPEPQTEF